MSAALISLAVQAGAPLIRDILSKRIGAENTELAEGVLGLVANRAGVSVDHLPQKAHIDPGSVRDAIVGVEADEVPGLLAIYAQDMEFAQATLAADQNGAAWKSAWRPAGMYVIGFLWLWNVVLLHVINAVFKIALPPMPFEQLFQLTALFSGLYMGGHTAKDVAEKVAGIFAAKRGGM